MITTIVNFTPPSAITLEDATDLFEKGADNYRVVPGLIRKYYLLSNDGSTAGGVYLWESKEKADAFYNQEWLQLIEDKYHCKPIISYFQTPVIVDNFADSLIVERPKP
ncbi:MAG: monooxygenase [Gammaproteobacteria bacterium]|nr:MAG: monooxygenase [Gammaproteobacteria bacterium]RLA23129.1 MAG: monooxygenase [Gammaproteobacteria bacterium]